jgi:hypothetical protein
MEMENVVTVAASEVVGAADGLAQSETPVIAAAWVQGPIPVVEGVQAPVHTDDEEDGRGKRLLDWNLYKEETYIAPSKPYNTNIVDDWSEVTRVCLFVLC